MNKNELEKAIFTTIVKNGVDSSKDIGNDDNPMEDKVYTRRININARYKGTEIVCVSITSNTPSFDDITNESMTRINAKNSRGMWCNIFTNEATKDMLEFIYSKI